MQHAENTQIGSNNEGKPQTTLVNIDGTDSGEPKNGVESLRTGLLCSFRLPAQCPDTLRAWIE
jgi:hypothetical protein